MRNPGAPRPLENRYSHHPMLAHEGPDELDLIEARKEEPMSTCKVEGCGGKILARGMCSKHYMQVREERKKAGTWNPKPKGRDRLAAPGVGETSVRFITEPAPKAAPQAEKAQPEPIIFPHKGKLYLLAEIRIMTEEQLREMVGG